MTPAGCRACGGKMPHGDLLGDGRPPGCAPRSLAGKAATMASLTAWLAIARPIRDPAAAGLCARCATPIRRYGCCASTLCSTCKTGAGVPA